VDIQRTEPEAIGKRAANRFDCPLLLTVEKDAVIIIKQVLSAVSYSHSENTRQGSFKPTTKAENNCRSDSKSNSKSL